MKEYEAKSWLSNATSCLKKHHELSCGIFSWKVDLNGFSKMKILNPSSLNFVDCGQIAVLICWSTIKSFRVLHCVLSPVFNRIAVIRLFFFLL